MTNVDPYRAGRAEPNRRQEVALGRIEFAVGELATVLLAHCRSPQVAAAAIREIRHAIAPAVAVILAEE